MNLLHVIQRKDAVAARHDLSGAIGLGVKSELLEELARIDEAEARLAIDRGRAVLAGAEVRLRAAGLTALHPLHRHGGIVETIVEREAEADLVVIGKRGASREFASDHIGSKVERVVRASVKPVLVASRKIETPSAAVIAFDGSAGAFKAVDHVAPRRCSRGLPCIWSWPARTMRPIAPSWTRPRPALRTARPSPCWRKAAPKA